MLLPLPNKIHSVMVHHKAKHRHRVKYQLIIAQLSNVIDIENQSLYT